LQSKTADLTNLAVKESPKVKLIEQLQTLTRHLRKGAKNSKRSTPKTVTVAAQKN
jgi:hypothetical protein